MLFAGIRHQLRRHHGALSSITCCSAQLRGSRQPWRAWDGNLAGMGQIGLSQRDLMRCSRICLGRRWSTSCPGWRTAAASRWTCATPPDSPTSSSSSGRPDALCMLLLHVILLVAPAGAWRAHPCLDIPSCPAPWQASLLCTSSDRLAISGSCTDGGRPWAWAACHAARNDVAIELGQIAMAPCDPRSKGRFQHRIMPHVVHACCHAGSG